MRLPIIKVYVYSGAWVAKKKLMENFPLDENLAWGEGEDVEWSKRIRDKIEFKFNSYSQVKLLKYKPPLFLEPDKNKLKDILEITNQILS